MPTPWHPALVMERNRGVVSVKRSGTGRSRVKRMAYGGFEVIVEAK